MRAKLLTIFFVGIFLSLGIVSALSCSIATSCNSANRLMAVSGATNAHGEVYDAGNYNYYVCCDEVVNHGCGTNNEYKVIGLSSSTNAHAEIPSLSNYGTPVCFEGYTCAGKTTCNADETAIMSLSSSTNAHIGGANDYTQKICCKSSVTPYAFWSDDGVSEIIILDYIELGVDFVILVLNNSDYSSGTAVYFNIYEYDSLNGNDYIRSISGNTDVNGKVTAIWTIIQTDIDKGDDGILEGEPYEFYFEVNDSTLTTHKSPNLEVTIQENECVLNSASWSVSQALGGQEVSLNVQGNSLCNGRGVSFDVKEKDPFPNPDDDVETNPANVFFSGSTAVGKWIAEWPSYGDGETDPTYYFTATVSGVGNKESNPPLLSVVSSKQCIGIAWCSNYGTESECNEDMCSVGVNSVEANNPDVTCGTAYNAFTQCNETTDCGCEWNSSAGVCQPVYEEIISDCEGEIPVSNIGTCNYNENSEDNCDDGILTYSWSALWTWGDLNHFTNPDGDDYREEPAGTWRYDPKDLTGKRKSEKCVDGENSVSCPAQIQLPFFNEYTTIATVLVIVLIYIIINNRCKKKGKKKRKK